jgi:RsiW-degrading membrane proteinase PrsW (M82 family)
MERATELEYLKWFYLNAVFGPGECDVRYFLNKAFVEETGKALPEGYEDEE